MMTKHFDMAAQVIETRSWASLIVNSFYQVQNKLDNQQGPKYNIINRSLGMAPNKIDRGKNVVNSDVHHLEIRSVSRIVYNMSIIDKSNKPKLLN